jgi:hypothetical protein
MGQWPNCALVVSDGTAARIVLLGAGKEWVKQQFAVAA